MNNVRTITTDLDTMIDYYLNNIIDSKTINKNRKLIEKKLNIKNKNFNLNIELIKKLFLIFDTIYFKNLIQDKLYSTDIELYFKLNEGKTNYIGNVNFSNNIIELEISQYIINTLYNSKTKDNDIKIFGLKSTNIIDLLIKVMEHEITHIILLLYNKYNPSDKTGHNSQFINIVNNMYRHTDIAHDLNLIKVGMKTKDGIIFRIKNDDIYVKTDDMKVKIYKYDEITIIDKNYKPFLLYIKKLKSKLKVGKVFHTTKFSAKITKIDNENDIVYFIDENTNNEVWLFIVFIKKIDK